MSSKTISIKRHNHRIHPCDLKKKNELLNFLINKNSDQDILVVTSNDPEIIRNILNDKNITVTSDAELAKSTELKGELLISYDLPDTAISYMLRLSRAITHAIILLDESQHKKLYPIERILERTILQEYIYGFKPEAVIAIEREKQSQYDKKVARDSVQDSEKQDYKRPKSSKSHYLGKDENGKPIFSGKSGERNHRYDGTPKSDDEKRNSNKKPYKKSNSYDDRKPKDSIEKRTPRKFGVKSLKDNK